MVPLGSFCICLEAAHLHSDPQSECTVRSRDIFHLVMSVNLRLKDTASLELEVRFMSVHAAHLQTNQVGKQRSHGLTSSMFTGHI